MLWKVSTIKTILKSTWRFQTKRFNSSSNFPLISPLLNHRMLGKSHFMTNIDEETILELLQTLSTTPIHKSDYTYCNIAELPRKKYLPPLPNDESQESLSKYISQLTTFQYPRQLTKQIDNILLAIVDSQPGKLNKSDFLKILLFQHYTVNDRSKFKTLSLMNDMTDINQDIDFDNILLSETQRPTNYKFIIDRLEYLTNKQKFANINTWYYLFNAFKNPEPKVKMLDIMQTMEIPLRPILMSLSSVKDYLTTDTLLDIYREENISIENNTLTPQLFNQLIASYLKDDRIEEAWGFVMSDKRFRPMINAGLFVVFTNHFLKNNQLGYAFAFSKFMFSNYKIVTSPILNSMILNVYLAECEYFDNWLTVLRLVYPTKDDKSGFVNTKTMSYLNDYCSLHNLDNTFSIMTKHDKIIKNKITKDLVWDKSTPIFNFEDNSANFKKTANLLNQLK